MSEYSLKMPTGTGKLAIRTMPSLTRLCGTVYYIVGSCDCGSVQKEPAPLETNAFTAVLESQAPDGSGSCVADVEGFLLRENGTFATSGTVMEFVTQAAAEEYIEDHASALAGALAAACPGRQYYFCEAKVSFQYSLVDGEVVFAGDDPVNGTWGTAANVTPDDGTTGPQSLVLNTWYYQGTTGSGPYTVKYRYTHRCPIDDPCACMSGSSYWTAITGTPKDHESEWRPALNTLMLLNQMEQDEE